MNLPIMVIGAGGHAGPVIEALQMGGFSIIGILDANPLKKNAKVCGVLVIGNDEILKQYPPERIRLINGVGSVEKTTLRRNIFDRFRKRGYSFFGVIHPSAVVSPNIIMADGVHIMASAIIQTGCRIGTNVIINTGAIIDHDCIIGAHAHVAPGAVLSGGVQIGDMAHIGTAATVIQGIKIGPCAVIGAGAVVLRDIPPGVKAVGIPARIIE